METARPKSRSEAQRVGGLMEKCPKCRTGNLYESKEECTDGTMCEVKQCFACGYYWDSSAGYDELSRRLHKEYFPTDEGWKASPNVGRPFTSPEHWTEP